MALLQHLLGENNYILTSSITSNYTVNAEDTRIEVDATNSDIIITLPTITENFKYRPVILIKRIDDTLNIVTINGTSGNYEDDGIILFGLEATQIYASNANIWRAGMQ